MARFAYSYRSKSTYNTTNGSSRKAYYDDEDESDDAHPRHTSPRKFDEFITKVRNEATRSPPRFTHVTSSPYNGYATNNPIPKHHDAPTYANNFHDYGHGYGDYNNKDGPKPKPTAGPVYNSGYGDDYGNFNNSEGPKTTGSPVYNTGYGNDYNSREGPKTKSTGSQIYNTGYGGDYNSREGPKTKSTGSQIYNTGYGGDYNSREGPKPKPIGIPVNKNGYGGYGSGSPTRYGNDYDDYSNYQNKKKVSSRSDAPMKGTQLTKATNNIEEAMEMLMKEAAMPMRNGPKPYEYDNKPGHRDGSRPAPASTYDRTMNLVNETGGRAPQTQRPKGNLMPQRFNFNDGNRSQGYDEYGVINHKEAEKKFNGVTLDHKEY